MKFQAIQKKQKKTPKKQKLSGTPLCQNLKNMLVKMDLLLLLSNVVQRFVLYKEVLLEHFDGDMRRN